MTTGVRPQVRWLAGESLDGIGAADHDCPYAFGRLPRAVAPFPFPPGSLRDCSCCAEWSALAP